jgi:glutamyl-tRNA synthetase
LIGSVQERVKTLSELPELVDFFYIDPENIAQSELTKAYDPDISKAHLMAISALLSEVPKSDWTAEKIEVPIRTYVKKNELKPGQLFTIIRVAITGRTAAPGLFETLEVLGSETSCRRLEKAVKTV